LRPTIALSHASSPPARARAPAAPPPPPPRQIHVLDSSKIAAAAGPQADVASFVGYVQRNVALNAFRTGLAMSTLSTASFVKTELATALRKNPYQVNLLIGGSDKGLGPSLFYIDYLGACVLRGVRAARGRAASPLTALPPLPPPRRAASPRWILRRTATAATFY
jgi:hypothetical protein